MVNINIFILIGFFSYKKSKKYKIGTDLYTVTYIVGAERLNYLWNSLNYFLISSSESLI